MAYTPEGKTREKIFHFVRERVRAGRSPTVREVQEAFGFHAVETARRHLGNLITEGKLEHEAGKSRGYRLPEGAGILYVPILGRVQAGALTTAVEETEGFITVSQSRGRGDLFALRVRGESMTGAGILPGDIVIVRPQSTADSGDIVVALVGDEATVKRLHLDRQRVELYAENPEFPPIIPASQEIIILGKVIEVRRYLE